MSDETYVRPPHGWTCFFCGETFMTPGSAQDHFGSDLLQEPGCLIDYRVQVEEGGKPMRGRGLLIELRKEQQRNAELSAENEQLDHEAGAARAMEAELQRLFGENIRTPYAAWLQFEAMESRAMIGDEDRKRLQRFYDLTTQLYSAAPLARIECGASQEYHDAVLALTEFRRGLRDDQIVEHNESFWKPSSSRPFDVEHLGTVPCHTPACGWREGMDTCGPADVVRVGRLVRVMCQRCGGNWGTNPRELEEYGIKKRA